MFVCVHLLSILRFVALKFLFRFLFEVYKVLTECLRSPFLSHTHAHTDAQSCSPLFVHPTLSGSLARSLSLSLSQLLLLPPTEADVATTRRCSSNYAGTHAYMFVCMCVCTRIWVNLKFLERKLVVPLAALQMDESDMAI